MIHIFQFKPEFEAQIRSGEKTSTIRPPNKRKINGGDIIEFRRWAGKPYRSKHVIIGHAKLTNTHVVRLYPDFAFTLLLPVADVDEMARQDGFPDYAALWSWFKTTHGPNLQLFIGNRYVWGKFIPGPATRGRA